MADTLWESLCKNAAYKLIAAFPGIVRTGSPRLGIPPLIDTPLPGIEDFDLKRRVVRCKEPDEIGDNHISVTENRLNGLDTVARYEAVRFTRPDAQMVVPLVFREVRLDGKWKIRQQCKSVGGWIFRSGTYACTFRQVQIDLTFTLDTATGKLSGATAQLTDRTGTWKSQPDVTMKFDNASPGEQKVIGSLMTAVLKGEIEVGGINFKDEVRKAVGGEEASQRMRKIVQAALDAVLGAEPGSVMDKLERKLNEAWASVFQPGNPHSLPNLLPDPLSAPGEVARVDAGFAFPSIPLIGWTTVGNAQFVIRNVTIHGLKSVRPTGPLKLSEQGRRAGVSLSFVLPGMKGDWALEQKIRKGICAFRSFLAALQREPSDENLDPFRRAEKDLRERGGAMGGWYVSQWYRHGEALQKLVEDERFKKQIERFHGLRIWERGMEVINSSDWSQPIEFPASLQDDALALLIAALDLTEGTPLGKTLDQIVTGRYVLAYMNKNYEQVLAVIAAQTPPAGEEEGATAPAPADAPAAAGQEDVFVIPGDWTAQTVLVAAPAVRITTGDDGKAPKVSLLALNAKLGAFDFDYSSRNPIVWLAIMFQKLLFPRLKDIFLPFVQSRVEQAIESKAVLPESFGKVIEQLWDTAIPLAAAPSGLSATDATAPLPAPGTPLDTAGSSPA